MISILDATNKLNISIKKMRYYMYTKEIEYEIIDNKYYLNEDNYDLLKKIVLLRRIGLSFEDIDEIKKSKNLNKFLLKMDNLIPENNKFIAIKIVINEMLKDKCNYINMESDKYLSLVDKLMKNGKKFYDFKEDITYEDYKSSKFNLEYIIMITILTFLFIIVTLFSGNLDVFMAYFPFYFIGLFLTLFIFYIPIKYKYYKRINNLLKRNYYNKD